MENWKLTHFQMGADICNWSLHARLVNLIIRLRGQAYMRSSGPVLWSNIQIIHYWLLNYKRDLH